MSHVWHGTDRSSVHIISMDGDNSGTTTPYHKHFRVVRAYTRVVRLQHNGLTIFRARHGNGQPTTVNTAVLADSSIFDRDKKDETRERYHQYNSTLLIELYNSSTYVFLTLQVVLYYKYCCTVCLYSVFLSYFVLFFLLLRIPRSSSTSCDHGS